MIKKAICERCRKRKATLPKMESGKKINKLFSEVDKTNAILQEIDKRLKAIEKIAYAEEEYKFKCLYCGVSYHSKDLLDAHLKYRGVH